MITPLQQAYIEALANSAAVKSALYINDVNSAKDVTYCPKINCTENCVNRDYIDKLRGVLAEFTESEWEQNIQFGCYWYPKTLTSVAGILQRLQESLSIVGKAYIARIMPQEKILYHVSYPNIFSYFIPLNTNELNGALLVEETVYQVRVGSYALIDGSIYPHSFVINESCEPILYIVIDFEQVRHVPKDELVLRSIIQDEQVAQARTLHKLAHFYDKSSTNIFVTMTSPYETAHQSFSTVLGIKPFYEDLKRDVQSILVHSPRVGFTYGCVQSKLTPVELLMASFVQLHQCLHAYFGGPIKDRYTNLCGAEVIQLCPYGMYMRRVNAITEFVVITNLSDTCELVLSEKKFVFPTMSSYFIEQSSQCFIVRNTTSKIVYLIELAYN